MKYIPHVFTLLNLFFGCLAIIYALQTDAVIIYINDQFSSSFNIPEKISIASIFIIIAGVVDFLDGFAARLLKATSEMGKQLDSLSDVVSFGVAPAVIIYQLLKLSYAREANGLDISAAWLLPALLIACAAAYRLARFNLTPGKHYVFHGIPTPPVGLLIASFPLILHFNTISGVNSIIINKWFLYGITILTSYLMVSRIHILSLKFPDFTIRNNIPKIILLIVSIIAAFTLQWVAVPAIFLFYIILSLITSKKIKSE